MLLNAIPVARRAGRRAVSRDCKCIFDQIKANLALIQPQNPQNVPKTHFLAKSSRSLWVKHAKISTSGWREKASRFFLANNLKN